MKIRLICILLAGALLLGGCAQPSGDTQTRYTATFLTLFDTVTTIVGYAENQEAFQQTAQDIHDQLLRYHQLFDIYNDYDGLNNLKTVNDAAGLQPVTVEPEIIQLLLDCRTYYELTGGRVNAAMGSVLTLWHDARSISLNDPTAARLPAWSELEEAATHTGWDSIIIDEENSTVFLTDPGQSLDVGAVAKGWSAQRVAEDAPAGLLISVGGNVCATGPKNDGSAWVVGVQDPDDADAYLHTLYVSSGCVVTSGDYQRCFQVDGQLYHHIIDPDTLYPGKLWRSVSVVCTDSGLADALSTALFLMPLEEGKALLAQTGAEAMWMDAQGDLYYSDGFSALIRS